MPKRTLLKHRSILTNIKASLELAYFIFIFLGGRLFIKLCILTLKEVYPFHCTKTLKILLFIPYSSTACETEKLSVDEFHNAKHWCIMAEFQTFNLFYYKKNRADVA